MIFLKKHYKGLTLTKINKDKKRYISLDHIISKVVMSYDFIQKNRYTKHIYEHEIEA
jgi:ethanolamine utilization cobalamin adenosyltransferase